MNAATPPTVAAVATPTTSTRDGAITITALVDLYMAAYSGRDTTRLQRLTYWVARLGSVRLADVDDDHVFDALDDLATSRGRYFAGKDADGRNIMKAKRKPLASGTVNRYHAALSAVLTWAQQRRMTPRGWQNPCRSVALRPESSGIVRFLSDAERTALLTACRASAWPLLYLLVLLGLTTGARRGELEALRWRDIDFDRAEAAVHRTKNGGKKVLPLTPSVVEELRKHAGAPSTLLFASTRRPDTAYNFDPAWVLALKTAGVKTFRFHDLRHSCASALAQNGATLLEIAEVLGHRQLSVTARYSHLGTSSKSTLVNRVLGGIR